MQLICGFDFAYAKSRLSHDDTKSRLSHDDTKSRLSHDDTKSRLSHDDTKSRLSHDVAHKILSIFSDIFDICIQCFVLFLLVEKKRYDFFFQSLFKVEQPTFKGTQRFRKVVGLGNYCALQGILYLFYLHTGQVGI